MEVERVQAISKLSMSISKIPHEFIRSENEQPAIATVHGEILEVPTIDLNDPDEEKLVGLIAKAGSEWGLFQIVNHGIPSEVINKLQKVGKEFFELPQEEKEVYAKPQGSKTLEGYGTQLRRELQGKKDWVDHLFHRIWPPSVINYRFWPMNPPSYREANEQYTIYLRKVADKLFKCLSLGLGLEEEAMKAAMGGDDLEYLLKINYYPPCPRPDLVLGVGAHTDMCTLALLVPNEVPGLQVSRDGQWYDVKYIPNALIVHIGDQIEIFSNGKYKAVLHRSTVNKDTTRMSWPVFLEPPSDRVIGPHPKLTGEGTLAKYKSKKYGEYTYCKLNKIPQ